MKYAYVDKMLKTQTLGFSTLQLASVLMISYILLRSDLTLTLILTKKKITSVFLIIKYYLMEF